MRLTLLLVRRPRGTLAICVCLLLLGAFALTRMPVNLYPRIEFPVLTVSTYLSESSPEELEALITKPIEEAIADVPGLRKIEAISREGESQVTLQFHYDQEISEKAMEVRSRIRRIFPLLPEDVRFPVITRYDPSDTPILVLAVTGGSSLQEAGDWVNQHLKPQLSRIDGVATVRVAGAPRRQILVECDIGRLQAHSLTIRDMESAIRTSHAAIPAGFLVREGKHLSVLTHGKLETPEDVAKVSIKTARDGPVLKVGELAQVRLGSEEPKEITRYNGRALISVAVYRSAAADLRAIWKSVEKKLDELRQGSEFIPKVDVVLNQAEELETVLLRLQIILAVTALITACVLFAFLRTIRSTIVVLSAIPFSLLTTILIMQLLGVSLDMMSLGGLTLGVGILVDNAIVVVESISRRRSEGFEETDSAVLGTAEVAAPLILSTFTTIVVFMPVLFVSPEIRLLFVGFAWTICAGLFCSLIAALVLVPVLFFYVGLGTYKSSHTRLGVSALAIRYGRALSFLEGRRSIVLLAATCLLVFGVFQARQLSFRQTLTTEVRSHRVIMVMAPGTALEQTAAEALGAEQELMKLPFVKGVHSEIRDNQATLTVSLKSYGEGGTRDAVSSDRLKEMLKNRKEAQFHVLPVGRHGEETKISLYLEGPDADRLRSIQDQVRETLSRFLGIKDVIVRHRNPIPIVELKLDRALLETSGVNVRELAYHVRQNFTGPVSARIMTGERLTSIRVRALRDPHHGMEPLRQTTVRSELNRMVPFTELTSPSVRLAEGELRRQDRRPVVAMTLLLHKESDPLSIAREIRTAMDSIAMPSEYGFSFGDEIHDISRTRKEMFVALGMGLTLIYLILIVSTESLLQPLVIMTALPFGACGAVIALSLLHVPVSLPVYVGLMILCGLIVNVNVVMTYTINTMRSSGRTLDEAVSAGAQRRFRAILMTVLATIFATTPMLLDRGEGSSMWSPFALTLAVGIATSTLFSLVITPILYKTMERLKQSMRRFTAS